MRTLAIITILAALTGIAHADNTVPLPVPITVTNTITELTLKPTQVDDATGTYTVTAVHESKGQIATTNGVTVAARSQIHITVSVTAVEQIAWLKLHGMPELTLADYADTPITPTLKTTMITTVAFTKVLPVIAAALKD